jgi:hypothetical protein
VVTGWHGFSHDLAASDPALHVVSDHLADPPDGGSCSRTPGREWWSGGWFDGQDAEGFSSGRVS